MRGKVLLSFVFILFSFSFVFAATCADDQTIMRFYSVSNSHVSAWDVNNDTYLNEICYDDVFGVPYSGVSPHVCDGSNRVVSLYDASNSHASNVTDVDYDYEVCYGDLQCVRETGATCSNGGEIIARMSGPTNAHVSSDPASTYPVKICCFSPSASAGRLYWADMEGNTITEADFGDTVQLVARWTNSGTFSVYEDDGLPFGWTDDDIIGDISGRASGPNWVGNWTITKEYMDKTSDYDEFYFNINGENSEYLKINLAGNDSLIDLDITNPGCGTHYDEGESVTITVSAIDVDDVIVGRVSVNGENVSFSNGGITFDRVMGTPGDVKVVAEAFNSRGDRSRAISNIMVLDMEAGDYVDGEYVAACIDKPKNFEHIVGSIVEFDASTTRGVRIVGGVLDVLIPQNNDLFDWYWTFYPQGIQRNFLASNNPLAYRFTAEFPIAGDNSASLRVEI